MSSMGTSNYTSLTAILVTVLGGLFLNLVVYSTAYLISAPLDKQLNRIAASDSPKENNEQMNLMPKMYEITNFMQGNSVYAYQPLRV